MRRLEPWSTAALVRSHRDRVGLTQEALAERAGLSYRSVSDIERGISRTPYQATLRRLAEALELDEDDRAHLLASARSGTNSDSVPSGRAALPAETQALVGREREV